MELEPVDDPLGELDPDSLKDEVELPEGEGEAAAEVVADTDAVEEPDRALDREPVIEGWDEADADGEPVGAGEAVDDSADDADGESVAEPDEEAEARPEVVSEAVADRDGLLESVADKELAAVSDPVGVGAAVADELDDGDCEPLLLAAAVDEPVAELVGDGLGVRGADAVDDHEGLLLAEEETLRPLEPDGEEVDDVEGAGETEALAEVVSEVDPEPLAV